MLNNPEPRESTFTVVHKDVASCAVNYWYIYSSKCCLSASLNLNILLSALLHFNDNIVDIVLFRVQRQSSIGNRDICAIKFFILCSIFVFLKFDCSLQQKYIIVIVSV